LKTIPTSTPSNPASAAVSSATNPTLSSQIRFPAGIPSVVRESYDISRFVCLFMFLFVYIFLLFVCLFAFFCVFF
jgi:hypothetical protein